MRKPNSARPSKSWKSVSNRKGPLPRSLWRVVRRAVLSRSVPRGGVFFGGLDWVGCTRGRPSWSWLCFFQTYWGAEFRQIIDSIIDFFGVGGGGRFLWLNQPFWEGGKGVLGPVRVPFQQPSHVGALPCRTLMSLFPQIAIAIGVLTSNRGEGDEPLSPIGRGTRVPLQGGAIAGFHRRVPL